MSKTWRKESVSNSSKSGGLIARNLSTVKTIKTLVNRTIVVVSDSLGSLRERKFKEFDSGLEENIKIIAKGNMHKRRNRHHRACKECCQKHNLLGVMCYTAQSIA